MSDSWKSQPVAAGELPEDRIDTPHGTICVLPMSETTVRVASGRDVGWFRHAGLKLYATVLMRRAEDTDTWVIHPAHSAVSHVVDDKAGDRVAPDLRDAAYAVLRETFEGWLAERPVTMATVAWQARIREEEAAHARIRDLQRQLKAEQGGLGALRADREAAEAEVRRLSEDAPAAPAP